MEQNSSLKVNSSWAGQETPRICGISILLLYLQAPTNGTNPAQD